MLEYYTFKQPVASIHKLLQKNSLPSKERQMQIPNSWRPNLRLCVPVSVVQPNCREIVEFQAPGWEFPSSLKDEFNNCQSFSFLHKEICEIYFSLFCCLLHFKQLSNTRTVLLLYFVSHSPAS